MSIVRDGAEGEMSLVELPNGCCVRKSGGSEWEEGGERRAREETDKVTPRPSPPHNLTTLSTLPQSIFHP